MSVKTEPVAVGGSLAVLVSAISPILLAFHVDPHTVITVGATAAPTILAITAFVRQFVTPTSKVALTLNDVDKLAAKAVTTPTNTGA